MSGTVLLEWQYKPVDFIEESLEIEREGYSLSIGNGKVIATIGLAFFDANPQIREQLHSELTMRLQSSQLSRRQKYELSDSGMTKIGSDGRRVHYLEVKGTIITTSLFAPDIQKRDREGKVIFDTKKDRLREQENLTQLRLRHQGDVTLDAIFRSFDAALNDPDNALVHLYEIREAINTRLGTAKVTQQQLGISKKQFRRFGELCCDLPLLEGRHRGRNPGQLRPATQTEMSEAYEIASAMISAYMHYLEHSPGK